ncbi:MAG: ATP-binding protein [Bacteroidales bacterium]
MRVKLTKPAIVIFLVYLVIGFLYIFFSDAIVLRLFSEIEQITAIQTYKGWGFIIVTGIILTYLINREIMKGNRVNDSLMESREEYKRLFDNLKKKNEEFQALNQELANSLFRSREMNEALELARFRAEENDKLKTAFLNNMSHEIRTPMNGILGFSDLLVNRELPEEKKKEYGRIIKASGEQLMHIIDDILDISKLEAGQVRINESSYQLNQLIHLAGAIAENQVRVKGKKINIRVITALPDGRDVFTGDKTRVMQILNNLANNAVKFTNEGTIEIGYRQEKTTLVLFVKDSGIGIEPRLQKRIFERFIQTDETMKEATGGTGLGLAIVKGLAELMGGSVEVVSVPGKGSEFTVRLPVKT